ncbi:hypothetical protein B1757_12025 [Acidithiobacillus marinus]|uniref:Small-conductance mechanosensitive channel n=1 Tax=Acidithiobacillus marinus TaxID=187490 RepID=A0A2I1DJF5_9PROT|nr:mechanosensitive ion channel domain-containing protein [Acidithiobacillus marinus]PKY10008.1 hypothetical protein B1757_12025 [Acidithiobacillus marinus]
MSDLQSHFSAASLAVVQKQLWSWGLHVLAALLILIVGFWVARRIGRFAARALERVHHDLTVARFLESIIKIGLYLVVLIAALGQLGVQTTSLLAMLGAAGLAVGLALQKSLADFAAGVLLLIIRPYKVDDFVEVAGVSGTVERVHLFQTRLRSADNRLLAVPNGKVISGVITNYSVLEQRRIDLVFSIALDADLRRTLELVTALLQKEERVLTDPALSVGVLELTDTGVQIFARPWVQASDFWATRCTLLENIRIALDEQEIRLASRQSLAISSIDQHPHAG